MGLTLGEPRSATALAAAPARVRPCPGAGDTWLRGVSAAGGRRASPRARAVPVRAAWEGGAALQLPPGLTLSRTAVNASIQIFLPPFSWVFTFYIYFGGWGKERHSNRFKCFFLNGPIFLLCSQFSVQHSIVKFFWWQFGQIF